MLAASEADMNDPDRETLWMIQRDDGTVLARHNSKTRAVAAMLRFSADGCSYAVVEDANSIGESGSASGKLLEFKRC